MNQDCPGPSKPGGPWRTYNQGWTWLDDEFAAIVCHGYPSIHPLAATIYRPISPVPPPRLPCGCSTEPRAPTAPIRIQIAEELARSGRFYENAEAVAAASWLTTALSPDPVRQLHIEPGVITARSRARVDTRTCSMFCPPSPYLSKNNRPRLTSPPKRHLQTRVTQPSISLKVRAMHVSALSRWTKAGVHKQRFAQYGILPGRNQSPGSYIPQKRPDRLHHTKRRQHVTIDEQPGTITCVLQKSMPPRMPAPKSGRRLSALNSPASRSQLRLGSHPYGRRKRMERPR